MVYKDRVVSGVVIGGKRLGRDIGYPTANIEVDSLDDLAYGVYVVRVNLQEKMHYGVANYGLRPTVSHSDKPVLETHILDFCGDIYGQEIKIEFIEFLRAESRFNSIEELIESIERDTLRAFEIIETL